MWCDQIGVRWLTGCFFFSLQELLRDAQICKIKVKNKRVWSLNLWPLIEMTVWLLECGSSITTVFQQTPQWGGLCDFISMATTSEPGKL